MTEKNKETEGWSRWKLVNVIIDPFPIVQQVILHKTMTMVNLN